MKTPKMIVVNQYLMENYHEGQDFRYDVLSNKIQVYLQPLLKGKGEWKDITDRDLSTIAYRCAVETNCNVGPKDILVALQSEDLVAEVNPLRDWLNHLPAYDPEQCGMDLIDMLFLISVFLVVLLQ